MGVLCENYRCIYEEDGECCIEKISVNEYGMCDCCIFPTFDDEVLKKAKDETFQKLEGQEW